MKPKPLTEAERNKKIASLLRKLARMAEKGKLLECSVESTPFDDDYTTIIVKYFEKERKND